MTMIQTENFLKEKLVKIYLKTFTYLVVLMIAVGGVTRLTRSGLSIVEWKPVTGILPPIGDEAWDQEFEKYKNSPEYNLVNSHFELSDYKQIYFWEYFHRLLGRFIFLFTLGFGIFVYKKSHFSIKKVLLLSFLVALQGLIGWFMVKSGLNKEPHVSPYMLALHFFSALSLAVIATYFQRGFKFPIVIKQLCSIRQFKFLTGLFLLQVLYGCLTSGFKAGFSYNTYPLMGGQFFPEAASFMSPLWKNFLENPVFIQWFHRWLGVAVLIGFILYTFRVVVKKIDKANKGVFFHIFGLILLQVFLGILNIVYVVPVSLGVIHQIFASLILIGLFDVLFRFKYSE